MGLDLQAELGLEESLVFKTTRPNAQLTSFSRGSYAHNRRTNSARSSQTRQPNRQPANCHSLNKKRKGKRRGKSEMKNF